MTLLALTIEQKIVEAIDNGEFDSLPGKGRPLDLDENPFTPAGMGMAYKVLKNSGYVPREVELLREVAALKERLRTNEGLPLENRAELVRELRLKEAEVNARIERLSR